MANSVRNRLIVAGINRILDRPVPSWVFSTAAIAGVNFLRGRARKTEIIDLSGAGVGDRFVIEHLPITHKEQMKQFKREAKAEKRAARADRSLNAATRAELKRRKIQLAQEERVADAVARGALREERTMAKSNRSEARKAAKAERRAAKDQRAQIKAAKRAARQAKAAARAEARDSRRAAAAAKKAERAARKAARKERREARKLEWQARRDARNTKIADRHQRRADRARARIERG